MTEGVSPGIPSFEVRPEVGDTTTGLAAEGHPTQAVPASQEAPIVNKDQLIQELLKDVPPEKQETMGYAYRHLPHHMRQSGMSEEEIAIKLDEIKFPQALR